MKLLKKILESKPIRKYRKIRSSIYGHVVFIISLVLILLFIFNNVVFRSVNNSFFNKTINQNADNISSIVEGSLYHSMLENDKAMLQRTMNIISTIPSIDEVNMYDYKDSLAYTSTTEVKESVCNPNCLECHVDLNSMFSKNKKSVRIVDSKHTCDDYKSPDKDRHLIIRKPIINEQSCYTAACHAHYEDEEFLGYLIVKLPLHDLDNFITKSSTNFLIIAILITSLLVSTLIIYTRKKIKDPLKSIIKASEAVSNGNKSIRLDIKPNLVDDLKMVSYAFNNMLNNIETASVELQNWSHQLEYKVQKKTEELSEAHNELIHVERIASLGKLSSSVAHEINNPLSGILVYAKLIYKQLNNDEFYHSKKDTILTQLKFIETETKRCGDIVKGLLDFSKKGQEDFVITGIHRILEDTLLLLNHSLKIANINTVIKLNALNDKINCSPNQIKQACVALIVNAQEAIKEQGEMRIITSNPNKETIKLEIIDSGIGISQEDLNHIFEPFFSTKQDASGIGLGLSIVHGIIENHKGIIDVNSTPGVGTTFSITFPIKEY